MNGGRFDFDDGGTYCGGWEDGKAHGHGVCTGPKGQGEYSGAWHYGFEVSGVYRWPSGNCFEGQWQNGKRHGLGVERRGRWVYRGEWNQGYKGRYGVRQSSNSQAKYEGTWANGLQDGYGMETYADGGTYQGQWLRGMRHGYATRHSAPYAVAAKYRSRSSYGPHDSLNSLRSDDRWAEENAAGATATGGTPTVAGQEKADNRGGFVLRASSEPASSNRKRSISEKSATIKRTILQGLRITKQRSTGDIDHRTGPGETPRSMRSSGSCASDESVCGGGSSMLAEECAVDPGARETYMGEWKNDKRSGFGVSERSDGLKYQGEWFNNKKFGYGVTTFKDGTREEGKYKANALVTCAKSSSSDSSSSTVRHHRRRNLLFVRSSKLRERIEAAVTAATRAAQIAVQKADIAITRSVTARERSDQADQASSQAAEDSEVAAYCAKRFAPDFYQSGSELVSSSRKRNQDQTRTVVIGNSTITTAATKQPSHRSLSLNIPHHQIVQQQPYLTTTNPANSARQSSENYNYNHHNQQVGVTTPMFTPPEEATDPSSSSSWTISASGSGSGRGRELVKQKALTEDDPSPRPGLHFAVQTVAVVRQCIVEPGSGVGSGTGTGDGTGGGIVGPTSRSKPPPVTMIIIDDDDIDRHRSAAPPPPSADHPQSPSSITTTTTAADHFDQYKMAADPSAARLARANFVREQQRSLRIPSNTAKTSARDGGGLGSTGLAGSGGSIPAGGLIRRTTLATSGDWKGSAASSSRTAGKILHWRMDEEEQQRGEKRITVEGSVPDMATLLNQTPTTGRISREEAARLGSQRRQELQRMREEAELLRSNPLRYLYHPAVRAWLIRWKLPLLILILNFGLSLIFYKLITYSKRRFEGT